MVLPENEIRISRGDATIPVAMEVLYEGAFSYAIELTIIDWSIDNLLQLAL